MQFDLDRNINAAARDDQAAINAARGQLPAELADPNNKKLWFVSPYEFRT